MASLIDSNFLATLTCAPSKNIRKAIPAFEKNALKGTVTRLPAREDIDVPVEEHLIVELYSK